MMNNVSNWNILIDSTINIPSWLLIMKKKVVQLKKKHSIGCFMDVLDYSNIDTGCSCPAY
jgi:hypothetical protein